MDSIPAFRTMPTPAGMADDACIAVAHPSFPRPLPLARLDRHGLVVRAPHELPSFDGLPHDATLRAGDDLLCALRLVIRDIARRADGRHDVTMQPSCVESDERMWHTLRACSWYGHAAGSLAPVPDGAGPANADVAPRPDGTMRLTRGATFRTASRGDALFVSDWLEYHFDEFGALTRQRAPQLRLGRLVRQLADDGVGVRFVYDIDGHTTQYELDDCARAAFGWIEDEMRDKYAMPLARE